MIPNLNHEIRVPRDIHWPSIIDELDGVEELTLRWHMSGLYSNIPLLELGNLPSTLTSLRLSFPQALHVLTAYLKRRLALNPTYQLSDDLPMLHTIHLPLVNAISYDATKADLSFTFFRLPSSLTDLSFESCLLPPFEKESSRSSTPLNRICNPEENDAWNRSQVQFPPHLTRLAMTCDESVLHKIPSTVLHLELTGGFRAAHFEAIGKAAPNLQTLRAVLADSSLNQLLGYLPTSMTDIALEGLYLRGQKEEICLSQFPLLRSFVLSTELFSPMAVMRSTINPSRAMNLPTSLTRFESDDELLDFSSIREQLPLIRRLSHVSALEIDSSPVDPNSTQSTRGNNARNLGFPRSHLEYLCISSPILEESLYLLPPTITSLSACLAKITPSSLRMLRTLPLLKIRTFGDTYRLASASEVPQMIRKMGCLVLAEGGLKMHLPYLLQCLPPSLTDIHLELPYSMKSEQLWLLDFVRDPSSSDAYMEHWDEIDSADFALGTLPAVSASHRAWDSLQALKVTFCQLDFPPTSFTPVSPPHHRILKGILPPNLTRLELPDSRLHLENKPISVKLSTLIVGEFSSPVLEETVHLLPPHSLTYLLVTPPTRYTMRAVEISPLALSKLPQCLVRAEFGETAQLQLLNMDALESEIDSVVLPPSLALRCRTDRVVGLEAYPKLNKWILQTFFPQASWGSPVRR